MKKKSKLFASLFSFCFALAVLCFGVYAAQSVTYTIGGTLSYTVDGVLVNIHTEVYKSTASSKIDQATLNSNAGNIASTGSTSGLTKTDYTTSDVGTYDSLHNTIVNFPNNATSDNIAITYGENAYTYYIVITITNYGESGIKATITDNTVGNINSLKANTASSAVNIAGKGNNSSTTGYVVIGLTLDNLTQSINNVSFSYSLTVAENNGSNVSLNISTTNIGNGTQPSDVSGYVTVVVTYFNGSTENKYGTSGGNVYNLSGVVEVNIYTGTIPSYNESVAAYGGCSVTVTSNKFETQSCNPGDITEFDYTITQDTTFNVSISAIWNQSKTIDIV